MDALRHDLRFALRLLVRDKAFAATTVLTLALALGANAAIFAVVESVLLRPLPFPDADRLVTTFSRFPGAGVERAGQSVPNWYDHRAMSDVFDSVALYQNSGLRVGEGPSAEGVASMTVTPSFFRVLRATAARGRLFGDQDGEVGHEHVAVLSHGFAARQAGGLDHIVGTTLRLNNEVYTVVGVLPDGFTFLDPDRQVWIPAAFSPDQRGEDRRWSQNHDEIGRLAPGVSVAQAQARLDAFDAVVVDRAGALKQALVNVGYGTSVVALQADVVRNVRGALTLLWAGVLFVLLIAGVNLTNLSLVRASGRARELATRQALGAGRSRMTRQLVTETLLLTLTGGLLGVVLAFWSVDALKTIGLSDLPRVHEVRLDGTVMAFAIGLAALLGLVLGAVPAIHLAGNNLNGILREEGRSGTAGRAARFTRRGLVVAQVAIAFVLLAGAGLLLASFRQVLGISPGFSPDGVWTGRVSPLEAQYPNDAALRSYTSRILERIRAVPGVQSAGVSSFLPFGWDGSSTVIIPEGHVPKQGESVVSPNQLYVTPGYLEALRVPLRKGRFFTDGDDDHGPPVIIIDEQLARLFWPGADPIGRRIYEPQRPEDVVTPGPDVVYRQVVGVVSTVKLKGLIEGEGARAGSFYVPYAQSPSRNVGLAVRTSAAPASLTSAIERAVTGVDPELKPFDVFTMAQRIDRSLDQRRTPMVLSLGFSLLALLLASLGIYGVLAYQVAQRTREIGIRMALGSDPAGVMRLVLREGAMLVAVGLTAGAAGALLLRQVIASQLYGVGLLDPLVLVSVVLVLAAAAFVACIGPARRAAKVSPVVALTE